MKQFLIAGNWKSNKTVGEATQWTQKLSAISYQLSANTLTVVLFVPFTLLYSMKQEIERLKLLMQLGAQDVSPFSDGAFTGEVSARQVKECADWVIIGHSERREHFGETDTVLRQKVDLARSAGLRIIYCVQDEHTSVPSNADVIAYEPVWAIGTGKSDTPENANQVIGRIKANSGVSRVIYGGSVTPDNVSSFMAQESIDGVLPGGASLDAEKFSKLITCVALCSQK